MVTQCGDRYNFGFNFFNQVNNSQHITTLELAIRIEKSAHAPNFDPVGDSPVDTLYVTNEISNKVSAADWNFNLSQSVLVLSV